MPTRYPIPYHYDPVSSQLDLPALCTALENLGRDEVMRALANAKMAVSAKHHRPRMVLTSHLQRSGCALVTTQKAGDNVLKARVVDSQLPKAIAASSLTTRLAFTVVTVFIGAFLCLICATAVVYMSYYTGLCKRSLPQSPGCRARGRGSLLNRGVSSVVSKPGKAGVALHSPTESEIG